MATALALVLAVLQLVPQHLWACTEDVGVAIVAIVNPCADDSVDLRQESPDATHLFQLGALSDSCCSEQHTGIPAEALQQDSKQGLELCCVAVDQLATAAPAYVVPDYGPVFVGTLPLPAITLVPLFEPRTQLHGLPALLPDRQPVLVEPRPPAQLLI